MGDASVTADLAAISAKYAEENAKRLREDGLDQYEELTSAASERLRNLGHDLWADHKALNAQTPCLRDGDDVKVLILGAGYGGILYAIRLIEQGFSASDIRLVDVAGGYGGTWWWNRFPGLTCDTEGYIYMPLLEETGYMPKHRYSGGPELLRYANLLVKKWDLEDKGLFRATVKSYDWDDEAKRWIVAIEEDRGPSEESVKMKVKAQFTVLANGVLNHPKVPKNFESFAGPITHTARWDYSVSGGTHDEPNLEKFKGKRVGVVGTGATAVQVIPEVAKWAKELYVFQRTPSSVEEKPQKETDPEEWKVLTAEKGWHRRRAENMDAVMSGEPGVVDTVKDGWTAATTFRALCGGYHEKPITMEDIPNHIGALLAEDSVRTERLRLRVEETVKDKKTAEALKAWYPTWCKRPTFHNDYLPTFNLPHVHLIDTDGKGAERATEAGIVANGQEYPLDVLILSTGFRPPTAHMAEPSSTSNMSIRGRNGLLMSEKWDKQGPTTYHGVLTHDFPNMFLTGPLQVGASSTFSRVQDILAEHSSYIIAEAFRRAGDGQDKVVVEVTAEGEEVWAGVIMSRVMYFAGAGICGPSINNSEGQLGRDTSPEGQMKSARGAPFGLGLNAYVKTLEAWRAEGSMAHVDVTW